MINKHLAGRHDQKRHGQPTHISEWGYKVFTNIKESTDFGNNQSGTPEGLESTTAAVYKEYGDVNEYLRNPDAYNEYSQENFKRYVDVLDKFIGRTRLTEPVTVFRGFNQDDLPDENLEDQVINDTNGGYVSTTLLKKVAKYFGDVIMEIHLDVGQPALWMEPFMMDYNEMDKYQQEFLLPRDTQFEVISDTYKKRSPGKHGGFSKKYRHLVVTPYYAEKQDE